jgi:hypothetical protein
MKFCLKGKAYFEADGIDDAIKFVGNHFLNIYKEFNEDDFIAKEDTEFASGDIRIHPIKKFPGEK